MPTTVGYPARLDGSPDPVLSRWRWLFKWVLLIPHYVVLVLLWIAFAVLTVVAIFAILFTGRYPRTIFDVNVGVLRWTWRVHYYGYGALATDSYPPFTMADVPTYPARLVIDYPEHLSRGLVLVKWWLLAIPHYLIVGFSSVVGRGSLGNQDTSSTQEGPASSGSWRSSPGDPGGYGTLSETSVRLLDGSEPLGIPGGRLCDLDDR